MKIARLRTPAANIAQGQQKFVSLRQKIVSRAVRFARRAAFSACQRRSLPWHN